MLVRVVPWILTRDTHRWRDTRFVRWPRNLDPRAPLTPATRADRPLPVSVVIPAHNRADTVGRAVRSARGQRPAPPAEVIVVDDGSTDDTAAVAIAAGARVVSHARKRGAAAARNSGIAAATHAWIAPLDSDDEWLPHLLHTLWPLRQDNILVGGASLFHSPGIKKVRTYGPPSGVPVRMSSPAGLVFPGNFITSAAVLVSRDAVLEVGGYDTSLGWAEDFDLWLRLLSIGPGVIVPTAVALYHTHAGQKSLQRESSRAAQWRAVAARAGEPWYTPALARRRRAAELLDEVRVATWRDRVALVSRVPLEGSTSAALYTVGWRLAQRRHSSSIAFDGGPRLAVLAGGDPALARGRSFDDLRGRSRLSVALTLILRPPAMVIGGDGLLALLAGRLRIERLGSGAAYRNGSG